jgi:hypothetical protein
VRRTRPAATRLLADVSPSPPGASVDRKESHAAYNRLVETAPRDPKPRGPWPSAALLAIGVFFVSDAAIWQSAFALRFLDRYTPLGPTDCLMTVKARLVPPATALPLVLLLGSSQVREGLDCAVFEERLAGRPCRNLASIGGTPLDALYLDARITPGSGRTVVIGLFPWMMHEPPKTYFTDTDTVRCLVAGEAWRHMAWKEIRDVLYGLAASLSESLRNRAAVPRIYAVVSTHPLDALRFDLPSPARRLGTPLGERLSTVAWGTGDNSPPTFTAAQEAALDQLIARTRARGDRPVVVDFPTRPGYDRTISPRMRSHYARFVESLGSRRDIVFVGAADLPALTAADFNDLTHLSATGRAAVSRRLAEVIAGLRP